MHRRKIAYISGTRADFGLMTPVLSAIRKNSSLFLQLYATGMHLMPKFGKTVQEVKKQFPEVKTIPAKFKEDSRQGMAYFAPDYLKNLIRAFVKNRPDFVLTLGDRIEMLYTATACLYLGIPTGQLHGGETTSTVDEVARHAITKLSHIHFPATKQSATRIATMGEERWRIHVVGAPALDVILHQKLPSRKEVYQYLHLQPGQPYILVTQHPESETWETSGQQMKKTLLAAEYFHFPIVVTYPNADAGGHKMIHEIEKKRKNPNYRILKNSPYTMFLAMEREAAVWIGNSSAAMIESSSFHVPVVNIGDRQHARQHGQNVLNVPYNSKNIIKAMQKSLHDKRYRSYIKHIRNPWGDGQTGNKVVDVLTHLPSDTKLLNKRLAYE